MSEELVVAVSAERRRLRCDLGRYRLGAPVIAADMGLEHALALGLEVTRRRRRLRLRVAGGASTVAEASGTRIDRASGREGRDRPSSLALDVAAAMSPERILVLCRSGGCLDHESATLLLLASQRYADIQSRRRHRRGARSRDPGARSRSKVRPASSRLLLRCTEQPKGGQRPRASRTRCAARRWRAGSNFAASRTSSRSATASVTVERGVLLAIRPGDNTRDSLLQGALRLALAAALRVGGLRRKRRAVDAKSSSSRTTRSRSRRP